MLCFYGLLSALCTLPRAHAQAGSGPAQATLDARQASVIAMRYDPLTAPVPIINLSVNGSAPLPFVIDTGSNQPVIFDTWAANELHLPPAKDTAPNADGKVVARRVLVKTLDAISTGATHKVTFDASSCSVVDLDFVRNVWAGEKIAGIIGAPAFSRLTAQFDFARHTLSVFTQPHPPLNLPAAFTSRLLPGREGRNRYYVPLGFAGKNDVGMLLDTGTEYTSISKDMAAVFAPVSTATASVEVAALGRTYTTTMLLLPDVTLGTVKLPYLALRVEPDPAAAAILGMNLLACFRVTLDIPNMQLLLEPSDSAALYNQKLGKRVVDVEERKDGFYTGSPLAGSTAAQAGVAAGAKIVSVDGQAAASLPLHAVLGLLDGYEGTQAQLVLLPQGRSQSISITYKREGLFVPKPQSKVGIGLSMNLTGQGTLIVTRVTPGTSAQEAGVAAGDLIVKIDGQEVSKLSVPAISAALDKPEGGIVTIEVQRTGEDKPRIFKLAFRNLP